MNIQKEQPPVTYNVTASEDEWLEVAAAVPRGHRLRARMTATVNSPGKGKPLTLNVPEEHIDVLRDAAAEAGVSIVDK